MTIKLAIAPFPYSYPALAQRIAFSMISIRFPFLLFSCSFAFFSLPLSSPLAAQEKSRELSLEEALRLALGRSEQVHLATAGLTVAEGARTSARAERLPQLNSSFSYSRALASQFEGLGGGGAGEPDSLAPPPPPPCSAFVADPTLPIEERVLILEQAIGCSPTAPGFDFDISQAGFGQKNTYNLGFSFVQPLYQGGRISAQQQRAEAGLLSAALEVDAQSAQSIATVARTYYDALLSARLLSIAEESLANAEETLELSGLGFEIGTLAEYDVLRARVARDNERSRVAQQRSNRALSFLALKQQLNIPSTQEILLTTSLDEGAVGAAELPPGISASPDTSTSERIAVRQADAAVEVQEAQVRIARSAGRPNVSIVSNYGLVAYPSDLIPSKSEFRDDWTVGLQVSLPLFTGGRVRGSVVQAEGALEQARARLQQTREGAVFDARSRQESLESSRAALGATSGTAQEALRALEIAHLRYQQGLASLTEVSDARLALATAQTERARAVRNHRIAEIELLLIRDLPLGSSSAGALGASAASTTPFPSSTPASPTSGVMGGAAAAAPGRGVR